MGRVVHVLLWALVCAASVGCAESPPHPELAEDSLAAFRTEWEEVIREIDHRARRIERQLQPVPLLTDAEIAKLRSAAYGDQLTAARRMGIGPDADSVGVQRYAGEGRLVRLVDGPYWVVRDLDYSRPYATPEVVELLEEVGARFQERLGELGLPPLRFEISSALRTAESQDALRSTNPNAAAGTSTHQFGTSVDVAYSGYAAPEDPLGALGLDELHGDGPSAVPLAQLAIERSAARKSRELQALLGQVLLDLQREGEVMVTLERRQPVYHLTLAIGR